MENNHGGERDMAYPDPRLRLVADRVSEIDAGVLESIQDLLDTLPRMIIAWHWLHRRWIFYSVWWW